MFIGLLISYIIFHLVPGDPIYALLPHSYTEEQYIAMANYLGFEYNQLLGVNILRFSKFLGDFFTGAWGWSGSLFRGMPVIDLIFEYNTILHVILLITLPLIIGIVFMIKKSREKSIFFNSLVTVILFSAAFILYVVFSILFDIRGFGKLLVDVIGLNDHYLITGCLFVIVIMFVILLLISNVILSVYKLQSSKLLKGDLDSNSNHEINTKMEL